MGNNEAVEYASLIVTALGTLGHSVDLKSDWPKILMRVAGASRPGGEIWAQQRKRKAIPSWGSMLAPSIVAQDR